MWSVIVEPAGSRGSADLVRLAPGTSLTFGRSPDAGLTLPHRGVSRLAGEIAAVDRYWTLTNHSPASTYVVENPEGAGEHVKVAPRRQRAPVPFEIARLVLPAGRELVRLTVYAPSHDYGASGAPGGTLASFPLDETAKYFLVLVALAEPRLRDESLCAIPSNEDIARRLAALPGCAGLTVHAVNFHLDYLARTKLRLRETGAETRRAALVTVALRFDLVREEHLALLPPRASRPLLAAAR